MLRFAKVTRTLQVKEAVKKQRVLKFAMSESHSSKPFEVLQKTLDQRADMLEPSSCPRNYRLMRASEKERQQWHALKSCF